MADVPYTFDSNAVQWVSRIVRWFRTNGLANPAVMSPALPAMQPVFVKNTESEEIPPFACMHVTGTADEDGYNYLTVAKPSDTDSGTYVFNSENAIESKGRGLAQSGSKVRVLTDEGEATNLVTAGTAKPVADQWYVEPGGMFLVVGEDDVADDCCIVWMPEQRQLYRFETTESMPIGTDAETGSTTIIKNMPKTVTHTSSAVLVNVDGMIDYLISGAVGIAYYELGKFWFVQAKCGQTCETTTEIGLQTPTNATIGSTSYSWTPTFSGTVSNWAASGLPSGWAVNSGTGAITGPTSSPGVVGPARSLPVTLTATVPQTGGGNCSIVRKINIPIVA